MQPRDYLEKKRALLTRGHHYDCVCDVCMEFDAVLHEAKDLEEISKYRIPLKPKHEATKLNLFTCPTCGNVKNERTRYCEFCGQSIDWDGESDGN